MTNAASTVHDAAASPSSPLTVYLDDESKQYLSQAAELRHLSVSDYVRLVLLPQAIREVRASEENIITLTPEEQLQFWNALNEPVELTPAQRRLAAVMRGEE